MKDKSITNIINKVKSYVKEIGSDKVVLCGGSALIFIVLVIQMLRA